MKHLRTVSVAKKAPARAWLLDMWIEAKAKGPYLALLGNWLDSVEVDDLL